jgi:hypothetical protein
MVKLHRLFVLLMAAMSPAVFAQTEIPLWGDEAPPYSKQNTLKGHIAPCKPGRKPIK